MNFSDIYRKKISELHLCHLLRTRLTFLPPCRKMSRSGGYGAAKAFYCVLSITGADEDFLTRSSASQQVFFSL